MSGNLKWMRKFTQICIYVHTCLCNGSYKNCHLSKKSLKFPRRNWFLLRFLGCLAYMPLVLQALYGWILSSNAVEMVNLACRMFTSTIFTYAPIFIEWTHLPRIKLIPSSCPVSHNVLPKNQLYSNAVIVVVGYYYIYFLSLCSVVEIRFFQKIPASSLSHREWFGVQVLYSMLTTFTLTLGLSARYPYTWLLPCQ